MQTLTIPKKEYDDLKHKATLFDKYVETETLTKKELEQIQQALKGSLITKNEFLQRHPELS